MEMLEVRTEENWEHDLKNSHHVSYWHPQVYFSWQQCLTFGGTADLHVSGGSPSVCERLDGGCGYIWSGHVVAAGKVCWNEFHHLKFPQRCFLHTFIQTYMFHESRVAVIQNIWRNERRRHGDIPISVFRFLDGSFYLKLLVTSCSLETPLISSECLRNEITPVFSRVG